MRRAELLQPQEFSIEVRNRHKAKAAAEAAAADQQPSAGEGRAVDAVMPGSAAAEQLGAAAASDDPVLPSQPPRNERQALLGSAAGHLAAEHSDPQPARWVPSNMCSPCHDGRKSCTVYQEQCQR